MKRALLAALIVLTLAGCAGQRAQVPPLMGVYEPSSPVSWTGVTRFISATGVHPQITSYYSGWREDFRVKFALTAWRHGSRALVQISPDSVTLASVAAGNSDDYLRSYALAVKAFGHPVILSFGHEMNGYWYSWGDGHTSPATFVAAWRHIVDVFRGEGVRNVTWMWTINTVNGTRGSLQRWWPGNRYVTWVGVDGYFRHVTDTYESVFRGTITQVRQLTPAPILIAETAVITSSESAEQVHGIFAGAARDHLLGVVWFDKAKWRLENNPAALAAYRCLGH